MMGPPGAWDMMRSMRRKEDLAGKRVGRATAIRIVRFARPYRWLVGAFLVLVIASSLIAVANPVLAGKVINAISSHHPGAGATVVRIALLIGGLAVIDALVSLGQRFLSARIGEGIIYDLR